jgi:hypothetical protein
MVDTVMGKKRIRIHFSGGFDWSYIKLFNELPKIKNRYEFVKDDRAPQLVIHYEHPKNPLKTKLRCKYLFYCCEYIIPNMHKYDYALQWRYTSDPRQLRYPNYVAYGAGEDLVKPKDYDPEKILRSKTKFCAFVYYKAYPYRNQFFSVLNSYKHVDAPGLQCNNMSPIGGYKTPLESRRGKKRIWAYDIRDFFKDYKFVIAFENRITSGYVTEKIYNPMTVNSLPIYLGSPDIQRDFNPKSFVHVRDFFNKNQVISPRGYYTKEFNEAAKYILELDKNDKLYCDTLAQPWCHNNIVNEYADKDKIADFYIRIFNSL